MPIIKHLSAIPTWMFHMFPAGYKHNYQSYLLKVKNESPVRREEIMTRLAGAGIATRRGIMAIHQEPAYASAKTIINLSVTEECALSTMTIPLYPQMNKAEVNSVISEIKNVSTVRNTAMDKNNNGSLEMFPDNPYHPFCWVIGKPEIGKGTWIGPFTVIDAKRAVCLLVRVAISPVACISIRTIL